MIHQLKIDSKYFEDVVSGKKTFEVRNNDRNFYVGDFIALNELTPHPCNEEGGHFATGRCCLMEIAYILRDNQFVKEGYVVLGIKPCRIIKLAMGCRASVYESCVIENEY